MTGVDTAENKAKAICNDVNLNIDNIVSEEDAKIQIINRLLTESLGWSHKDITAENHHDNGYSDYILKDNETLVLLIEAKRIGRLVIDTAKKEKVRHLKISGSALKKSIEAIEQAANYSLPNGIQISVVTDGLAWIVFKTFVTGTDYRSKEAVVFPSIEAVINDFSIFYELLSKEKVQKRLYNTIFDEIHNNRVIFDQNLVSPIDDSEIKLMKKSDMAFDLDRVFRKFFSRLTGDEDEDLLIECFVESRESRIADFSLEKMATSVLGNISSKEKDVDSQLASVIIDNIENDGFEEGGSDSGETIFIVGPTGAGKSTFLDRFFRKTLPNSIRKQCVLVNVNSLDATGRGDTALDWLTEELISELEKNVYKGGFPEFNDLMGLYHGEYQKRAKGVDAILYGSDREGFKLKFSEYLEGVVQTDREGYLKRILKDVVDNRKMLPVIVIDNTDEFPEEYKKIFFQFIQSLRRHANHCLIIFPVTDKSAWSFSKTDIYSIYKSKSFFLPTPSPREVFRKRIDFIKERIDETKGSKSKKADYFLSKGIRVSIDDLNGFARVLEDVFVNNEYTSKTIGELANYNIRRTLALSQRVITSPVIKIDDLVKSFLTGELVKTSFAKFIDALLKGDYESYKQADSHEVYPVFQVNNKVRQSPLLVLRILALLDSINNGSRTIEDRHLSFQSINEYFDSLGCSESALMLCLTEMLSAGLVEPYDVSSKEISYDIKVAISFSGMAHFKLACHNSVYFYQMALTCAITNPDAALKIRSIYTSKQSFPEKTAAVKKEFLKYLINEDNYFIKVESTMAKYECQRELIKSLKKYCKTDLAENDSAPEIYSDGFVDGEVKEGVVVTVDFYDYSKGFGFAESTEIDSRIFIHAERLKGFDINTLKDGDEILCDLSRGDRGVYVEKIHDIVSGDTEVESVDCHIIRLFPDRGYGFVNIKGGRDSAFFHITVFPDEARGDIREGVEVTAEIGQDKKGGYLVKKIFSVEGRKIV